MNPQYCLGVFSSGDEISVDEYKPTWPPPGQSSDTLKPTGLPPGQTTDNPKPTWLPTCKPSDNPRDQPGVSSDRAISPSPALRPKTKKKKRCSSVYLQKIMPYKWNSIFKDDDELRRRKYSKEFLNNPLDYLKNICDDNDHDNVVRDYGIDDDSASPNPSFTDDDFIETPVIHDDLTNETSSCSSLCDEIFYELEARNTLLAGSRTSSDLDCQSLISLDNTNDELADDNCEKGVLRYAD